MRLWVCWGVSRCGRWRGGMAGNRTRVLPREVQSTSTTWARTKRVPCEVLSLAVKLRRNRVGPEPTGAVLKAAQ